MRFLFTHSEQALQPQSACGAADRPNVQADVRTYLLLLYSSAANLLSFAGYSEKSIYDAIRGYGSKPLTHYG